MRGGYRVGLNLDEHALYASFAEDSFWQHVDSQASGWMHSSAYKEVRDDGCLAAKSDGYRCGRMDSPGDDPFCSFHMTRALEWFLGRATQEQIRKERSNIDLMAKDARQIIADAQAILGTSPAGARVYFYELEGQGLVKIGTSHRPETRTKQFRSGKGCTFPPNCDPKTGHLLGHIAGDIAVERALHQRYRPQRVAGEWFRLTDELANHIDSLLTKDSAAA